jgi:hypothetical protein
MVLAAHIVHGLKTFRLGDPGRDFGRNRLDIDSLNERWQSTGRDDWVEGQVHPEFPGMIVDDVRVLEEVEGQCYIHTVKSLGDSRGTRPTKIIGRSEKKVLTSGWDEQTLRYITWHARWRPCTADAATGKFNCPSHGFSNGSRATFRALTGGAEIDPSSEDSLGTAYFVCEVTPHTFKISETEGGAVFDIGTDVTAGKVCASEFVKGARHPEHEYMFLVDIGTEDEYTDWQRAAAIYRGMIEPKPYHRVITCNGQSMSPKDLTVTFTDGFTNAPNGEVQLPKIVCTDNYLAITPLPTDEVPLSEGEGATPPDPPDVRSMVITATLDKLTLHWPNGWSQLEVAHVETIPLAPVSLQKFIREFIWPATFA